MITRTACPNGLSARKSRFTILEEDQSVMPLNSLANLPEINYDRLVNEYFEGVSSNTLFNTLSFKQFR